MRQTVAKRLRKEVYGDKAEVRKYVWEGFFRKVMFFGEKKMDKKTVDVPTQIQATGLREAYQKAKKEYNMGSQKTAERI